MITTGGNLPQSYKRDYYGNKRKKKRKKVRKNAL